MPSKKFDFFRRMLTERKNGSLSDYWRSVSYGNLDLSNSEVSGWHREKLTLDEARAKAGGGNPKRQELVSDCINAARNDPVAPYEVPPGNTLIVATSPSVDLYGGGGQAFVGEQVDVSGLAHELGHAFGLNHSFSDDPNYRNVDWAAIGEYDDQWDVMSYAHVHAHPTLEFGNGGPGLNGFNVDSMGWMPKNRIQTVEETVSDITVTLTALNHPESQGFLLVRVPFDRKDPNHYYTVEYRKRDGWDAGIPGDTILIHEVKRVSDDTYRPYLLRERQGSRQPVQSLNRDGILISLAPKSGLLNNNQVLVAISRK